MAVDAQKLTSSVVAFSWFPLGVFLLSGVAVMFNAYDRVTWLDAPMHFLGGIAMSYFFANVLARCERLGMVRVGSSIVFVLLVIGLVAISTILWEFAEFFADTFFDIGSQRGIANSMRDQFLGLLGGAAYLWVRRPDVRLRRESRS